MLLDADAIVAQRAWCVALVELRAACSEVMPRLDDAALRQHRDAMNEAFAEIGVAHEP
ncbi:MAG: hypothetical protein R3B72_40275 [Polyangiaceae bacterium]